MFKNQIKIQTYHCCVLNYVRNHIQESRYKISAKANKGGVLTGIIVHIALHDCFKTQLYIHVHV